ncbi:MAG: T9SS type A sorting domain-containing protein, partial [Flavobacteriales bacterium]
NSSYYYYHNFYFGTGSSYQDYEFFKFEPPSWNSYYNETYDWEKRSARLGYFEAGETINLQFSTYSGYSLANGSAYDVEVYIDDIRIFNRSESSPSFIAQGNDITINNSRIDLKIAQLGDDLGVDVTNSTIRSVNSVGDNSPINLYNSTIIGSTGNGIGTSGDNSPVSLTYSFVTNCLFNGIETVGQSSDINLNSSLISHNGGYGLKSNSKINTNYSNITFNDNDGIYLLGNSFSNIKNSIIWGNDIENYNQINTQSGVTSITYSSVQGLGAYGTEGSQYYFGDGAIDDDPVFTDQINQHLSTFSNCVDAGTPWENDNHMPFGLGGVRADIGIYGGPDNWFWGGEPIPDGSPIITAISDSPQDQGGIVGVLFDKSVWDDNDLENKVTSYSIWRNFDAEGNSIDTISDGNWQLMGYMPAQAFDAYAYEAPTLGDSSLAEGSFNSCFVILAHTQDSSVYWYSDVMCGYSTDDISPNTTEVFAELVNEEEVMISWNPPTDEDYSYSEVISSSGFNTSNITDTLTYDISFESGDLITYGVIHYDVNGNPSDTSFVSIQIEDQKDYIPLYQGWNLISTRLTPNENNMPAIFSSLEPNNLIYATGFNNGVSVYDPNGLPFLNTLSQFDDGYGYWVKVNEDDTLVINGNPISHDFIPPYNAGWNLMGYTEGVTQSISSYFDFLLNENNLIYVTNFNQGAAFYDPNGLPFLNSLNYVEDNLGYWVKTSSPFGGIAYRLSHDSQEYSPNFMLINGESNLSEYIGNKVQVYNQLMEKIAELEIIEGGYLMTNAIYGDDPATEVIEGMENGELLSFGFMNHIIEDKIEFNADMNLRKVNLNFEVSDVISIYPNPLRDLINIRINEADDCELDIQIFDIAGRLVYSDLNRAYFKGSDKVSVDFSEFENGAYYLKLFIDNELRFNESIIKQ